MVKASIRNARERLDSARSQLSGLARLMRDAGVPTLAARIDDIVSRDILEADEQLDYAESRCD